MQRSTTIQRAGEALEGGWASFSSSFMDALSSTPSKLASAFNAPTSGTAEPNTSIGAQKPLPTSPSQKTAQSSTTSTTSPSPSSNSNSTDVLATFSADATSTTSDTETKGQQSDFPTSDASTAAPSAFVGSHPLEISESRIEVSDHTQETVPQAQDSPVERDFGDFGDSSFFEAQQPSNSHQELVMASTDPLTSSDGFGDWEEDSLSEPKTSVALSALTSISEDKFASQLDDTPQVPLEKTDDGVIEPDQVAKSNDSDLAQAHSDSEVASSATPLDLPEIAGNDDMNRDINTSTQVEQEEETTDLSGGISDTLPSVVSNSHVSDTHLGGSWNDEEEESWTTKDADVDQETISAPVIATDETLALEYDSQEHSETKSEEVDRHERNEPEQATVDETPVELHSDPSSLVDNGNTAPTDSFSELDWNEDENGWNAEPKSDVPVATSDVVLPVESEQVMPLNDVDESKSVKEPEGSAEHQEIDDAESKATSDQSTPFSQVEPSEIAPSNMENVEYEEIANEEGASSFNSNSTPSQSSQSSFVESSPIESNPTTTVQSTSPTDKPAESSEPTQRQTETSPSESPSMKHLQSKLDVLTRILDEREKQLATRSSVMADLQNENEKLKSELEAFKSAQQRMKSSNQSGSNMIEALQTEFSERISTMETKYRATVKDRDKLAEQLKSTTKQLEGRTKQLEDMKSEMEVLGVFDASKAPTTKSTSQTNSSIVDSAFSSFSSMLLSPSQQSVSSATSSSSTQATSSSAGVSSMTSSVLSDLLAQPSTSLEVSRKIDFGVSDASVESSSASDLSSSGKQDLLSLQEKVKRYEGALRELLSREKVRSTEKAVQDELVRSMSAELEILKKEKEMNDKELVSLRESERRIRGAQESQNQALSQKVSALDSKRAECEGLDREVASLKAELESSWRLNDSLKKEVEAVRLEEEEKRKESESKIRSQNADALSSLGAKSMQQQLALQTTISELRSALDGNTKTKGTQEEAMEQRIAELERAQLVAEQLLTSARQSAELAQTPLLKQISDLQLQLTHQQRSIEAAEDAWKTRAQTLENALAAASHDLQHSQSQLRIAEQTQHKVQQQYARLEHAHQTLQIEHEHLITDTTAAETDLQQLQAAFDAAQTQLGTLNSKIAAQKMEREEIISTHTTNISKLEATIQQLQARIASLTTPGTVLSPSTSNGALESSTSLSVAQSPGASRSHSPNLFSTPSSQHLPVNGMSTPSSAAYHARQSMNTSQTALEAQISLIRAEKTRLEELLANAVQTAATSEELEKMVETLQHDREQLQERLDAALELVAEQSERLQYVDEEIAETKQLYKDEITNLVSQLQLAQMKLKDAESHLSVQHRS